MTQEDIVPVSSFAASITTTKQGAIKDMDAKEGAGEVEVVVVGGSVVTEVGKVAEVAVEMVVEVVGVVVVAAGMQVMVT